MGSITLKETSPFLAEWNLRGIYNAYYVIAQEAPRRNI